jgi:RimJ/RimL family protein N-acetyltransferase
MLNSYATLHTARLLLRPVCHEDLPDLCAIKADPRVFAIMLGGVRTPAQTTQELAEDIAFWGANGIGMWTVREIGRFEGLTGIIPRPDGRGLSLRFAFWPDGRGRGLAREAATAALRYAHEHAGLERVIAVAREDNVASRNLLGAIGMRECETFTRDGRTMLVYESFGATKVCLRPPSRGNGT